MFLYVLVFVILLLLEVVYFKIADKYNIIDKPNLRSSHTKITLRGGGIVFYFSIVLYFIYSGFQYPWFFIGLTLMTAVSFLDDILTLSNRVRLIVQFLSVSLMLYQIGMFEFSIYYAIIPFILIVGIINAYNFMDGINGITAAYSISIIVLLIITNNTIQFINTDYLYFILIGLLVFAFFNFRQNAKSFAGDVGSVSIAFIIIFAISLLILKTHNLLYLLFLLVYGIDTIWTIIQRIIKKENIFEAHRSHLYQYLANEGNCNKLVVSFMYGLIQVCIGFIVIYLTKFSISIQVYSSICLIIMLSVIYLFLKRQIYNKYVNINK